MKKGLFRIEWPVVIARWVNYEYWPWYLFFLPLLPVWFYYAVRSGKVTYFTTANPGIPLGGLFGESKSAILAAIPDTYKPQGWAVPSHERNNILTTMSARGVSFPIVVKPDVGERGYKVAKIDDADSLYRYLAASEGDLIVQEYVGAGMEAGVLYHRFPGSDNGKVTSITVKKFLTVTGNGVDSIRTLMRRKARTNIQQTRIEKEGRIDLGAIPAAGEEILLEPIGNHCLGTAFLNGNQYLGPEIDRVFDRISAQFKGFHYGRFDLKVTDGASLMRGEGIRIFEVNGVTSEPGHIYDPGYSLWHAYRDTAKHMSIVYRISRENRKNGAKITPFTVVASMIYEHFRRKNKTPESNPGVPSYISEQI